MKEQTDWLAVAALIAGAVIGAFQIGKVPSALPLIRGDLGLTLPEGAAIISLFNVLGMCVGMACGALGDRFGHRRSLLAGLAAMFAGCLLGAAATGFMMLLVSRALEGLGFVVSVAATVPMIVRFSARRHQRLIFGFYGGYWPAGVATMILVTPLALDCAGWRGLWVINAVLIAVYGAFLVWVTRDTGAPQPAPASETGYAQTLLRALANPGSLVLMALFTVYSAIHGTLVTLLPSFYVEAEGSGIAAAAGLTALVAIVNVGGNVLGGIGLHVGLPRWLLILATFILLAASAVFVYNPAFGTAVRLAAATGLSFIAGVIPACILAGVPIHAATPDLVGTTNGMTLQGSQFGQFVGPYLTAVLVTAWGGWYAAQFVIIGAAALGVALALMLRPLERARFEQG